jgi:hypothetical protein
MGSHQRVDDVRWRNSRKAQLPPEALEYSWQAKGAAGVLTESRFARKLVERICISPRKEGRWSPRRSDGS